MVVGGALGKEDSAAELFVGPIDTWLKTWRELWKPPKTVNNRYVGPAPSNSRECSLENNGQ